MLLHLENIYGRYVVINVFTKWVEKVKLKGKCIWSYKSPADASWSWKKVVKVRAAIKCFIVVKIGDGRQTSLFYDPWLNRKCIRDMLDAESDINSGVYMTTGSGPGPNRDWSTIHGTG